MILPSQKLRQYHSEILIFQKNLFLFQQGFKQQYGLFESATYIEFTYIEGVAKKRYHYLQYIIM